MLALLCKVVLLNNNYKEFTVYFWYFSSFIMFFIFRLFRVNVINKEPPASSLLQHLLNTLRWNINTSGNVKALQTNCFSYAALFKCSSVSLCKTVAPCWLECRELPEWHCVRVQTLELKRGSQQTYLQCNQLLSGCICRQKGLLVDWANWFWSFLSQLFEIRKKDPI